MIFAVIKIPVKYTTAADPTVGYAVTAIALIDLTVGLLGRPILTRLGCRGQIKSTPIQRWMITSICILICLYSCMLLGFVLYILRARVILVELLFGASLISLLFWHPGTPPAGENDVSPSS